MSIMDTGFVNDIKNAKRLHPQAYRCWHNMRHRCCNPEDNISYSDVSICEEWKTFSNFLKWFNANYKCNCELDKDLLGEGNLYSPETCCFIPKPLNMAIRYKQRNNSLNVFGISKKTNRNLYNVQISKYGKRVHIGYAPTIEEAQNMYNLAKQQYIQELAKYYYDNNQISESIYKILCNRRYY